MGTGPEKECQLDFSEGKKELKAVHGENTEMHILSVA